MRAYLSADRVKRIIEQVEQGVAASAAAVNVGVPEQALEEWLALGVRVARGKYRQFADMLADAQGRSVSVLGFAALHRKITLPLRYAAHEAGTKFHNAQKRITIACAGRRGGKTQAGAAEFAVRYVRDIADKLAGRGRWLGEPHLPWRPRKGRDVEPFLRYAVVAPTYALLDEPRIALRRELGLVADGGVIVSQTDHVWWLVGGVRVDFLSGDRPERLVSHGYDGVWFEEGARLKRSVWVDNMRPTLSDKRGWAIWTTTPLGKNWFWEEVWARGDASAAQELADLRGCSAADVLDDEYAAVAWTTADNTKLPHLVEEMEIARRQLPPALFARNYLASFASFEGQCFDVDGSRHLRHVDASQALSLSAGLDLGQVHPSAASLVGVVGKVVCELWSDAAPGVDYYGDDAWARRSVGDRSTWANRIWRAIYDVAGNAWRTVPLYIPADGVDVKRVLRRYGFAVRDAYQAHEPAITWMSVALRNDRFAYSSPFIARALTNLRFPARGEHSSKLWVDVEDDSWDGLRYALSAWISRVVHGELPTATQPANGWSLR